MGFWGGVYPTARRESTGTRAGPVARSERQMSLYPSRTACPNKALNFNFFLKCIASFLKLLFRWRGPTGRWACTRPAPPARTKRFTRQNALQSKTLCRAKGFAEQNALHNKTPHGPATVCAATRIGGTARRSPARRRPAGLTPWRRRGRGAGREAACKQGSGGAALAVSGSREGANNTVKVALKY